jgi:hypothetical protein
MNLVAVPKEDGYNCEAPGCNLRAVWHDADEQGGPAFLPIYLCDEHGSPRISTTTKKHTRTLIDRSDLI